MTNIAMENHHVEWEYPLIQWPFSIAMLNSQRDPEGNWLLVSSHSKIMSSSDWIIIPIFFWKIKHVPNHQHLIKGSIGGNSSLAMNYGILQSIYALQMTPRIDSSVSIIAKPGTCFNFHQIISSNLNMVSTFSR